MSRVKRFFLASLAAACVCLMCGCEASVNLISYSDGDYLVHQYELHLDLGTKKLMEATAAPRGDGKWTLSEYLEAFVSYLPQDEFQFYDEGVDSGSGGQVYYAIILQKFRRGEGTSIAPVKKNPFFYTYHVTTDNPFNGVREAYDQVLPGQNATLVQKLKNGIVVNQNGAQLVLVPPLSEAFPAIAGYDLGDLGLNYYWNASDRMKTSGTKVKIDGQTFYLWKRYFDRENETVEYLFYRPNSLGWNLLAVAAGGLTVLGIVLAVRKKKPKVKPTDLFPYDPQQYADLYANLPAKPTDQE